VQQSASLVPPLREDEAAGRSRWAWLLRLQTWWSSDKKAEAVVYLLAQTENKLG
jgi:hypothetical protein